MAASLPESEPSPDQRVLLNAIWQAFRREHRWPTFLGVDQVLDRRGIDARNAIETMPAGLMIPDVANAAWVVRPNSNDELRVKLPALVYCDETEDELRLAARLVRYCADRELSFVLSSLSAPQPLTVTSDEARHDLDLTDEEIARAWALLSTFESWAIPCSGNPQQWSSTIDVEQVRRYRNVDSVESYLGARADLDRPQRHDQVVEWPEDHLEELSPFVGRLEQTPVAHEEHSRSGVLAPFLRHPLVTTIIGGAVAAVIAAAIIDLVGLH